MHSLAGGGHIYLLPGRGHAWLCYVEQVQTVLLLLIEAQADGAQHGGDQAQAGSFILCPENLEAFFGGWIQLVNIWATVVEMFEGGSKFGLFKLNKV